MEDRKFTSREAAELAGINPATFRSYFRSGHFRLIGSMEAQRAAKDGLAHVYSWHDVMGFAVAQALIERGAHPAAAFEASFMRFAMTGSQHRDPGDVYDQREFGWTYLAFDHVSGVAKVFSEKDQSDLFGALTTFNSGAGHGTFLLLNKIKSDVNVRLNEMRDMSA